MNAPDTNPIESLKEALVAQGFFPSCIATRTGWSVTLQNTLLKGRMPTGHGPLLHEAMLAADADRKKVEALIAEGDRTYIAPNPISYGV